MNTYFRPGVTTLDIVDAKGHDVQALQADTVPAQLANSNEGTVAVINGNYALQAGLHASDALAIALCHAHHRQSLIPHGLLGARRRGGRLRL